jgi:hypothetical protein
LFNDNNKAFDGKASYNIVINPVNAFGKPVISVDTVHKKNIRLSTDTTRAIHKPGIRN